ncbi:hypothetical protein [Parvibaculum sp.]|uniref:hypothetical protein n=1 Tax=Parvibaculum sp. TaxID=2024848 RepID=UPI0032979817
MDFHLDRQLRLLTEPERKSLYSWAITEVDEHGQVIGHDQIPWAWTLYFTGTEIVLSDQIAVEEVGEAEGGLSQKSEVSNRRTITIKLSPGDPRGDDMWFRQTTYRMFGTDRVIGEFQLDILPLESEDKIESCQAWGSVSYTAEIDFRDDTIEDCVTFFLRVKPSTFERYEQRIASGAVDEVILSVGRVSGFYSEWSPSISTREIKVLTRGSEHTVELSEGVAFDVPRLGSIGETNLYINVKKEQTSKLTKLSLKSVEDDEQMTSLDQAEVNDLRPVDVDAQLPKLLASLNLSARWIVVLLALLTFVIFLTG